MTGPATVMTVAGAVPVADLGVTLTHEHIFNDVTSWAHRTESSGWDADDFASRPVTEDIAWDLRQDPFGNLDNCRLDDLDTAIEEVRRFAALGGRTIIDATGLGVGRDLARLQVVSQATGVNIIGGTGYYLDAAHPADIRGRDASWITESILNDLENGDGGVRPGIIGEIGVGADFTDAEQASVRGAFGAQLVSGLPVQVHLPAWFRRGHEVLDLAEDEGVDPAWVVLCHMGPSGDDLPYQEGLLERGAWIQYDMIGMEVFYADQQVQCPSDEDNARWIARLVERGHGHQVLLSQDVFLKSLLRSHGGPGYAHVLQYFVPRLLRHGLTTDDIDTLIIDNPRRLFAGSAARHPTSEE